MLLHVSVKIFSTRGDAALVWELPIQPGALDLSIIAVLPGGILATLETSWQREDEGEGEDEDEAASARLRLSYCGGTDGD